jgi:hypothetical protein
MYFSVSTPLWADGRGCFKSSPRCRFPKQAAEPPIEGGEVHGAPVIGQRPHALFDRLLGVPRQMSSDGPDGGPVHQQRGPSQDWPGAAARRDPAAAPGGDRRQAEYFVRLLALQLQRSDRRIRKCRDAIVLAEAGADIENIVGFRRLLTVEQQERQAIEDMIANLQRRFSTQAAGPRSGHIPKSLGGRG